MFCFFLVSITAAMACRRRYHTAFVVFAVIVSSSMDCNIRVWTASSGKIEKVIDAGPGNWSRNITGETDSPPTAHTHHTHTVSHSQAHTHGALVHTLYSLYRCRFTVPHVGL